MRYTFGAFQRFVLAFAVIGLLFLLPVVGSLRQSEKKPKREDFGSSLEQPNQNQRKKSGPEKPAPKAPSSDEEIRLASSLAVFDALVLNKEGRSLTGFKKEDFVVTEDGIKQDIATVTLGDGTAVARSIVLILDYSGSQFPYIKTSTDAASVLIDNLGPKDKMALVTDDVALLVDFTNDKVELKNALESLKVRSSSGKEFGKSLQFSALMATLKELLSQDEQSVIIFQTDGDQLTALKSGPNSGLGFSFQASFSIEDLYATVEKSHATVYSVIPGPELIGLPENRLATQFRLIREQEVEALREIDPAEYDRWKIVLDKSNDKLLRIQAKDRLNQHMALFQIAKLSGGWTEYLQTPDKANEIYSRIFQDMNQRYIVTYYPTNTRRDGKMRKVKIEVRDHPEYVTWGRKSYYAPEN